MKSKYRLSMCVMAGVLSLALFSSQASALTRIGTFEDFKREVLAGVADSFVLTANIDCRGENLLIRGRLDDPFIGKFNGNNFVIHNFRIDAGDNGYVGLFGYLGKGAVIENLGVKANRVEGVFAVGALAGGSDGTIRRCFSKGDVSAEGNSAGGLVGLNGGVISESYSEASVWGRNNVGGLVGMQAVNVTGAGITDCYAAGAVTGTSNIGGLVGYVFGGSIRQCIATGNVTGTSDNVGGLVGYDYGSANSGWKTSGKTGIGGSVQKADIAKCFWNEQTTGQKTSAGATGKNVSEPITTERMGNPNIYGWDPRVWEIGGDGPYLKNAPPDQLGIPIGPAKVTLSAASFKYSGALQKPQVTVTLNGTRLRDNTDYVCDIISEDDGGRVSAGVNVGAVAISIRAASGSKYGGHIDTGYTITKAPGVNVDWLKPKEENIENVTYNSITIKPLDAGNGQQAEYSILKTKTPVNVQDMLWQAGLEFVGLEQKTDYFIFARSAEDRNHDAGSTSALSVLEAATLALEGYVFEFWADRESITLGESVTLSVRAESPYGGAFNYRWYRNSFAPEMETFPISGAYSATYEDTPPAIANYYYRVYVSHIDREGGLEDTVLKSEVITVAVNPVTDPGTGKKPVSSAAVNTAGALVRGRTLVMYAMPASGMQVRLIDMRGRTAARFVSGRGASFSLSGLPVGRYIVEVRDRGKRISASPVFLK